jgi:cytochrome c biogenesis protein CcmG/thiol:disulfide interchange protein DsbE
MNRFLIPAGLFALLVVLLLVGIQRAPQKNVIPSALLGKPAPAFRLPLLDGSGDFENGSFLGRWYLLNVWGTWCPQCRVEHDMLLEIARTGSIPIIGLNWKDEQMLAQRWLAELGDPYDVVPVDQDGQVAVEWGVYGAPETFLVDGQGIVRHRHVGAMTQEVWERDFLSRMPRQVADPPREPTLVPAPAAPVGG